MTQRRPFCHDFISAVIAKEYFFNKVDSQYLCLWNLNVLAEKWPKMANFHDFLMTRKICLGTRFLDFHWNISTNKTVLERLLNFWNSGKKKFTLITHLVWAREPPKFKKSKNRVTRKPARPKIIFSANNWYSQNIVPIMKNQTLLIIIFVKNNCDNQSETSLQKKTSFKRNSFSGSFLIGCAIIFCENYYQ